MLVRLQLNEVQSTQHKSNFNPVHVSTPKSGIGTFNYQMQVNMAQKSNLPVLGLKINSAHVSTQIGHRHVQLSNAGEHGSKKHLACARIKDKLCTREHTQIWHRHIQLLNAGEHGSKKHLACARIKDKLCTREHTQIWHRHIQLLNAGEHGSKKHLACARTKDKLCTREYTQIGHRHVQLSNAGEHGSK